MTKTEEKEFIDTVANKMGMCPRCFNMSFDEYLDLFGYCAKCRWDKNHVDEIRKTRDKNV